jgi:hypothetical protein
LLNSMGIIDEVKRTVAKRVRFKGVESALNVMEVLEPVGSGDAEVLTAEAWQDVEFEVALDSGSQDHVCDEVDTPGYATVASPGSARGQCFIVGDGGKLANMGQRHLNMQPLDDATVDMSSCFQIARVTRPLMSVGRMCDNGLKVIFDDKKAVVMDKEGIEICAFERAPGGLYLGKFRLKCPSQGFTRQG